MFVVYSNGDRVFVMKPEDEASVVDKMVNIWQYKIDVFVREEIQDDNVMISLDIGISIK